MTSEPAAANATFAIKSEKNYISIRFLAEPSHKEVEALRAELAKPEALAMPVVINCQELQTLSAQVLRALTTYANALKARNLALRLVRVVWGLRDQISGAGLATLLPMAGDLREALIEMGVLKKHSIDTGFVNPFLAATVRVLQIQAHTEAKPTKPALRTPTLQTPADISGVIGIVSESFNGSIVIAFPEATFLRVMSKMLGEEFKVLTPDLRDGAAELTNMIFGQAKVVLNEKGYAIRTALPTVVTGPAHVLSAKTSGPSVVVPFETPEGNFFVEIALGG